MLFVIKSGSEIRGHCLRIIKYFLLHTVFACSGFLILYLITGRIEYSASLLLGWSCIAIASVIYTSYLFAGGTILQPKAAFIRQIKALVLKHCFNVLMVLACLICYKNLVGLTFIIGYISAIMANLVILVKLKF